MRGNHRQCIPFVCQFIISVYTVTRIVLRYILVRILIKLKLLHIPILLVGAGKAKELVDCHYDEMLINYYKIIGFVDDNLKSVLLDQKYPRLGGFNDVEEVIKKHNVSTVCDGIGSLRRRRLN